MHKVWLAIAAGAAALLAGCGGPEQGQEAEAPAPGAAVVSASSSQRPAAFAQCVSCHAVEPGRNGVGPSLHGVVGRVAGSLPGYAYSPAMKAFAKPWSEAELDAFLLKPNAHVPGTKMIFPGMPDAARRKAVIGYLVTLK